MSKEILDIHLRRSKSERPAEEHQGSHELTQSGESARQWLSRLFERFSEGHSKGGTSYVSNQERSLGAKSQARH